MSFPRRIYTTSSATQKGSMQQRSLNQQYQQHSGNSERIFIRELYAGVVQKV